MGAFIIFQLSKTETFQNELAFSFMIFLFLFFFFTLNVITVVADIKQMIRLEISKYFEINLNLFEKIEIEESKAVIKKNHS